MTWYSNLQQAEWPTAILLIDFETYFDVDYHLGKDKKAISIIEYVADSRFEFTGLGFQVFNHPLESKGKVFIPGPSVEWAIAKLQEHFGIALHNCTIVAKNTKFDFLILAEKFQIFPAFPLDIEDLSRYLDSRMKQNLASLAKLFKLPDKGDTKQFKGQHWHEMDHAAMKKYCLRDIQLEGDLLKELLPIIDNPKFELNLMRHTLNLFLRPKLQLDYDLAEQLATDMEQEVHNILTNVGKYFPPDTPKDEVGRVLRTRKEFPAMLQRALGDELLPMKWNKSKKKRKRIPALAKTDEACQALLVHRKEWVRDLVSAKLGMTSWPAHAKRVRNMIIQCRCSLDRLRVPLKYYGGHTARWSGMMKINLQNLGGKGRGKAIHPLIARVRNCLVAPECYTLVIADSAQIEARGLAWIADCDILLKGFANGEDIYSEFAAGLFNSKVWKPASDDDSAEAKVAGIRRGFGKDAILGCGYGMGANKFHLRCRENETLRPLFDSGEYDYKFIEKLIKTYRTTYSKIPKFWNDVEKAFRWVAKYPNQTAEVSQGRIKVWKEGTTLHCQLPSGRVLFYRHMSMSVKGELKYIHGHLWGGSITENIVQALSRDLLGYWILEFEKAGFPVVLHAHDEAVVCVHEYCVESVLEDMLDIMRKGPEWVKGLPLEADGGLSKFYAKM